MRSFLWTGQDLKLKGAKVSWERVTRPKSEGGLGIKKSSDLNNACLAKLIWRICNLAFSSLWVDWVKYYLIRDHSFWEIPLPRCCSWTWRKIL